MYQEPSDERLKKFQAFHRIKFPVSFVELIKRANGAKFQNENVTCGGESRLVERLLCLLDHPRSTPIAGQYEISVVIAQIEERLTDDDEQMGTTLIPFAVLFGGDFLCLDYRGGKVEPSVVLWDHEESDELEPVTYDVSRSFDEFLKSNFVDL